MGIERIEELQEKFPEVPRSIIIKADVNREGISPSPALRAVGQWALTEHHIQFDWDRNDLHRKEDMKGGMPLIPHSFDLPDETCVKVILSGQSPYTIQATRDEHTFLKKYILCRDGECISDIFFHYAPAFLKKRTRDGDLMSSIVQLRGVENLITIVNQHCQYFNIGMQCRYCNMNVGRDIARGKGQEIKVFKPPEKIREISEEINTEIGNRIDGFGFSGGALLNRKKEAEIYVNAVKAAKEGFGGGSLRYEVASQAFEKKDAAELYDTGVVQVMWNLEVWDPKLFKIICPGKERYVGREKWIKCMLEALDLWQEGYVGTGFVAGVELTQPYGFKTMKEALKSNEEGFEWLLTHGIAPRFNIWSPNVGSIFHNKAEYLPQTEYFIQLAQLQFDLVNKYGLHTPLSHGNYRMYHKCIYPDFYHLCYKSIT